MKHKESLWRFIISLLLGFSTAIFFRFITTFLPYGQFREYADDVTSIPGWFIGDFFYPGAKHAVGAIPNGVVLFVISDTLFFGLIWFAILAWRSRKDRKASA